MKIYSCPSLDRSIFHSHGQSDSGQVADKVCTRKEATQQTGCVEGRLQVIRVVEIHYPICKLETARLYVEIEQNGKTTKRWYGYQDILRESGGREAVKRFRPVWQ